MDDLRSIMNISSNGNNGKAFMYQEVEVTVVERKGWKSHLFKEIWNDF